MHGGFHIDLKRVNPGRPPVLLLGGLNLVRALGFAGIPAIVATSDDHDPALDSLFCSGRLRLPPIGEKNGGLALGALLEAGALLRRVCGHPVPLLYGNDDHLALILAHRERMTRTFLLRLNDPPVAHALLDKVLFERFAQERGLPVPRTLSWDELPLWEGPVIAKHRDKLGWETSAVHLDLLQRSKARIFPSGLAATAHPAAQALRESLTFQEFVPGDDRNLWSFHGYSDANGRLLAWFVGRKIRTFPLGTGFSSYLELAHDDKAAAVGHEIAARIPLKGVFKIDLKQDSRTGRFLVIEINARFNLWHHVAARNGVNLPAIAYEYLLHGAGAGFNERAIAYRTRWRWLSFRLDARAARELVARGELGWARWLGSLLGARKVYDLFSWTDPLPFVRAFARKLGGFARRRMRQWLAMAS
ncbi:MAG TPA: hypothetical protein VN747_09470 [Burkholderiales bacterium]|nr:hypothetical protein [Burkholderiales bacterium]